MTELQVIARPHFLRAAPRFLGGIEPGHTLAQIVDEAHRRGNVPETMRGGAVVQVNGEIIPPTMWRSVKPKIGANVVVTVALHNGGGGGGGGGKNPIATVLSIAVIAAAVYFAPILAAGVVNGFGMTTVMTAAQMAAVGTWTTVFTAGIGAVGMFAVNAMFPARPPSMPSLSGAGAASSYSDSPTYSVTGASNRANPFGPISAVLGRHKGTPPYGAKPYTEILGNDEYLRMLFVWGYGPLKIEDIKIGETPIADFEDVEIETIEGRDDDPAITLYPAAVFQDSIGVTLTQSVGWIQRTSHTGADELSVDISFPRGLTTFSGASRNPRTVTVEIEYRAVGAESWTARPTLTITDQVVGTLRKGDRWTVARGQYEVRIRRTTADTDDSQIVDDTAWTVLRTFRSAPPTNFPYPLAMTAIRIRASEQLQGVISELNATVTSYAPDWNGTAWVEAETQNPASLMRLVLTGPANERRRTEAQLDDESFIAFWEFCDANGYKFNMVRDFSASVWDTCADICSAARASPSITDGLWSVIFDDADKPVTQHFTPRNSWGYKFERVLMDVPHAWRCRFVDEDNGFQQDERIVYDDGYDESNATKFEGIEFPGVTNRDLIWKHGRFHIAQARLRPEIHSFYADFEHLVCRRGDLIRVGHDVPMWGSAWGRVKSLVVDGSNTTGVILDEAVTMETGVAYACRFRLEDGSGLSTSLVTIEGEGPEIEFLIPIPTASGPQVGDLAMFGEADRETEELIVRAIRPGPDLTAIIECVEKAAAIYAADTGAIPAFTPNITVGADPTRLKPPAPSIVGVQSGTSALQVGSDGSFASRILVSLQPGAGTPRTASYVVRSRPVGSSVWQIVEQSASQGTVAISGVADGFLYEIQAQAISVYGVAGAWSDVVTETVVGQSELPDNPTGFRVNIIDGTAHLDWTAGTAIDISHARLRYSPELSGATWAASVDVIERIPRAATSVTAPAMAGTYLLKFVDHAGNESEMAAAAITNVTTIQGLNFIQSVNQESPSFTGVGDGVSYSAAYDGLMLAPAGDLYGAADLYDVPDLLMYGGLATEGTYVLDDTIDLGGVFTSRVTAALTVAGLNVTSDLYAFEDLYSPANLYGVTDGQYSASLEISVTADDPGASPTWGDWQPFLVGDYTGRAFRFRIRLTGTAPSITPLLTRVYVEIDMPDRTVGFTASVGTGGAHVTFGPAFFVTPSIGLSVSDGQEGDAYTITGLAEDGFNIAFTNSGSPVARTISGIAQAYGAKAA
ncbi:hypothetical protein A6A04_13500 [Paramagnetospirillum marisnigri]|uniref:Fibronectin type-III domain-containing protein n=1 Tax=Paramagnetospirillum marisnigri TaxID=1285242 RepID=A0A178MX61_9PROT|nr:host specificity factor TipJ family phage tail protein [Paramagnetospirillum marisnigri]OAN53902.1 hypothetical protein A6A04_13500 [Paramagnetospirillum marisnigri]